MKLTLKICKKILLNKEKYSKILIQKAQQFTDKSFVDSFPDRLGA